MPAVPGTADRPSGSPAPAAPRRGPQGAPCGRIEGEPFAGCRHPAPAGPHRPGLLRSWRSAVFAPVGDGQRRRRGSDGVRLACAVAALVCCLLVIRYDSRIDRAIIQVIHPPPWSITWLVTLVYEARRSA